MHRWCAQILMLVFVSLLSAPVTAEAIRLPSNKVSIHMRNVGLRDTLDGLLVKSGIRYHIGDSVTNEEKLSIQIEDAAWSDIFRFLIEQSNLDYRTDQAGRLVLEKRKKSRL